MIVVQFNGQIVGAAAKTAINTRPISVLVMWASRCKRRLFKALAA